jgi:predicted transcriptional regulator
MKTKKLKIIIKSKSQLKAELISALKGKNRAIQKENEIVFNSIESFVQILTKSRIEILIYLNQFSPGSIYALAKGLERDFKNVHSDVKKLAELSLIDLEPTGNSRNGLIPKAKYSGLELSLVS